MANPLFLTDASGRPKAVQVPYRTWLALQRELAEMRLRAHLQQGLQEVDEMLAGHLPKTDLQTALNQMRDELAHEGNG